MQIVFKLHILQKTFDITTNYNHKSHKTKCVLLTLRHRLRQSED